MPSFIFEAEVTTKLAVTAESFPEAVRHIQALMGTDLDISYANPHPPVTLFSGIVNRPARLVEIDGHSLVIE